MYEERQRKQKLYSEAGYNDRNDEHMEYRSERIPEGQKTRRSEVSSISTAGEQARVAVKHGERSRRKAARAVARRHGRTHPQWKQHRAVAAHGSPLRREAARAAAHGSPLAEQERAARMQAAPGTQNSSQGSTASWNAQASAQEAAAGRCQTQDQHHTTGGWAPAQTGVSSCVPPETGTHKTQRPQHGRKRLRRYRGSRSVWHRSR